MTGDYKLDKILGKINLIQDWPFWGCSWMGGRKKSFLS